MKFTENETSVIFNVDYEKVVKRALKTESVKTEIESIAINATKRTKVNKPLLYVTSFLSGMICPAIYEIIGR